MIYTFDNIYKLETDYNIAVKEFNKENDYIFDKIKINHLTDKVSNFILKGCEYNAFKSYPSFLERVGLPNFYNETYEWVDDEFEKIVKHRNLIFSNGIDFVHKFFNVERKVKNNILSKSVQLFGNNYLIKKVFTKIADKGILF